MRLTFGGVDVGSEARMVRAVDIHGKALAAFPQESLSTTGPIAIFSYVQQTCCIA